ncbi:MAG: hypothetical protein JRN16_01835 [Nitrososphaerota archaeon]|nr:hypothetical protein [Nitrososphaerota archaeon]MDG7018845.1 hypothetical protein [Nitrososphaerota archaeon]MDG7027134.1 hypothetical protein [Nitrososphaerota archaeon]
MPAESYEVKAETPGGTYGPGAASSVRRWMTLGLGALWVIDGLLQLQPRMFSLFFANSVNGVLGNALQSLPPPLYFASINFFLRYMAPQAAFWNASVAAIQLALGFLLIRGGERVRRVALAASVVWGLTVWVFGEGMAGLFAATMSGGVFPGTPSIMNGFPGAALVYAFAALLLLLPRGSWNIAGRFSIVRDAPAVLFLLLAAVQAAPLMWTTFGQSSIFAANIESLPSQASYTLVPIIRFAGAHPVLCNAAEVTITFLAGVVLLVRRPRLGYALALAWLGFIWWFGLGLGGTLTGLGTDPNTPPAIALLMIPIISVSRGHGREGET